VSGRRRFGAIRKLPSGRWQARYRDPETNRYRTAGTTFPTKTDAGRWLTVVEADMTRGIWHDPSRGEVLFADVAERWYLTKQHLRESTKYIYRTLLDNHILPTFGERAVGSITTLDVQVWIADRHANTRMGANSVAKTYKLLRTVMESALDAGLILRNPCRVKGAGTERLPEMHCATVEEVSAIAQAVEPRWQALVLLAAYSGLRWGELAGLRRRYLDPLHKTVRVVEQCTQVNGRFVWGPPKTSAGTRTVVLPQFICDVVVEHLAKWSEPGTEGLVFTMPDGAPLRRENFRRRVWLPACREAGVEGVRFHDLRHTNATLAAASGAPLRAVMHRLGHASAAAALRYQHRLEGQDDAIADFLDSIAQVEVHDRALRSRGSMVNSPGR
jgi:integrase